MESLVVILGISGSIEGRVKAYYQILLAFIGVIGEGNACLALTYHVLVGEDHVTGMLIEISFPAFLEILLMKLAFLYYSCKCGADYLP